MTSTSSEIQAARHKCRLRALYMRSETLRGYALMSPTLVWSLIALAVPLAMLLLMSFWRQDYLTFDRGFYPDNYIDYFQSSVYLRLLWKSIWISGLATIATVLLAYPTAYFIAFHVRQRKVLWLLLITLPFWTSYLLRVFSWKVILGHNGVINSGLLAIGWIREPLEFLLYNPTAVVITLAHAWAAFAILPIYVSLEKIDRSLLEAAADLGEARVGTFFRITLPLSMPGVVSASLLVFIPTTGDYVTPNLVGGSSGLMIGNAVAQLFGRANNWPLGAAVSIMSMLFITLLVCAFLLLIYRIRDRAS